MKKLSIILLLTCVVFSFVGCRQSEKNFEIKNSHNIVLMNGMTGTSVEISSPQIIEEIKNNICDVTFVKGDSSEEKEGWMYKLTWVDEDDKETEQIVIVSDKIIDYDGYYYTLKDESIDLDYYDKLFVSE